METLKKSKSHFFRLIALCIGAVIFIYTIKSFGGFNQLLTNLKDLKWFYLLVVINSFLWMLFYTAGWHQLFCKIEHKIRYLSLLKIKLSGEGVNFMTPLGFIAGDPVRVLLLRKLVGPEARLRSVVIDRLMHTLSAEIFCVTGIALIFTQDINFPLWLHILILSVYIFLAFIFIALLFIMTSGHGFVFFEHLFVVLQINRRFPKIDEMFHELRENLKYYHNRSKKPFIISFFCHLTGRVLGAVEILIVFYCYQGHADFVFALILASLTSFFSIVMGWIPGALGALEYLYAQFFMLYGFSSDVGLSVQVVRRLRVFFWIAVGILVLDYHEIGHFFDRLKHKRVKRG